MAENQTIQKTCADAMKNLARENDKLGCLLETLQTAKEIHLEGRELDGLRYQLEDVRGAIDCLLTAQCALAAANAETLKATGEDALPRLWDEPAPGNDR